MIDNQIVESYPCSQYAPQQGLRIEGRQKYMAIRTTVIALLLLLSSSLPGCGPPVAKTSTSNNGESAVTRTPKAVSSADAKVELIDTATQVEGPFVRVVEDIVDCVEKDLQPISVADSRMYESGPGKHKFADETIAAYKKWRAAKLAESKTKK